MVEKRRPLEGGFWHDGGTPEVDLTKERRARAGTRKRGGM